MGANMRPNYSLMVNLIYASKRIYLIIATLAGLLLLFLGTPYIHSLVNYDVNKYLFAWLIYSIAVFLNLYYSYWNPLLKGIGAIKEANQVQVISRVIYLVLTILGLSLGGGILWLSIMYLVSGLLLRIISKFLFERISNIRDYYKNDTDYSSNIKELLKTIWPNAKKQGLVTVGAWLITKSTTLLTSYFYGLDETAQLGLSLQLYGFIGGFSGLLFNSYAPEIISLKLGGNFVRFKKLFARTIFIQWIVSIMGCLAVVIVGPFALKIIGANSSLLPRPILIILGIILILEWNHSTFATLITLTNRVPFLASSLISGVGIVFLSLLMAKFTDLGVLGLILSQGIVQIMYNNWYWPRMVCIENETNIYQLAKYGLIDVFIIVRRILS